MIVVVIDSAAELEKWLDRCGRMPRIGLDTEADSLHFYPERLCLVQISLPRESVLVDPLADVDLAPLWKRLEDSELIIHAADYDLRLLAHHQGFFPSRVFDTKWAARLLGIREFGLGHLVKQCCGIRLEKGCQRSRWGQRPLTPLMIEYALNDVRYLHSLHGWLERRLEEKGRMDWLREIGVLMSESAGRGEPERREEPWRIRGSKVLDAKSLACLRELWHLREAEALRRNRPPYFVMSHELLLELAGNHRNGKSWKSLIPRRMRPRMVREIGGCMERAAAMPRAEWPPPHRSDRSPPMTQAELDRMEAIRKVRDARAGELGIDPVIIASRPVLMNLARDRESRRTPLMSWQRRLLDLE